MYYWPPWPPMASSSLQSQKVSFNNSDLSNWWRISIIFLFNGSRKSTETFSRKDSQAKIYFLEFALTFEIYMFFLLREQGRQWDFLLTMRLRSLTPPLLFMAQRFMHGHSRWLVYNRWRGWEIDFVNIPSFTLERQEALFLAGRRVMRFVVSPASLLSFGWLCFQRIFNATIITSTTSQIMEKSK